MEKQQKRAFDENLQHLQQNLVLDESFYAGLIQHEIFTEDMLEMVKSKQTTSARVMDLVQLVKKRSSSCFHDFIKVLKETSQGHLAARVLKSFHSQNKGGSCPERERLKDFLVQHFYNSRKLTLSDTNLMEDELVLFEDFLWEKDEKLAAQGHNQNLLELVEQKDGEIDDLQVKLDCYQKDIEEGQEKLKQLQIELDRFKGNTPRLVSRTTSQSSEVSDRFSPDSELREIIKQRDMTIKRNGQEYDHLKGIMEQCQSDLESLQELNSHYLMIISQLDDMQKSNDAQYQGDFKSATAEYEEIEEKLDAAENQVFKLGKELEEAKEWLVETQEELEEVLKRERKVKGILGLSLDASERQVIQRIRELSEDGGVHKKELDKLRKQLAEVKINRSRVEDKVTSLVREKEKVEFHLRQQNLFIKKLVRMKSAKETIDSASARIGLRQRSSGQLPTVNLTSSLDMGRSQLKLKTSEETPQRYCVLCRKDIDPLNSGCWFHFRALRGKKWQCCRDECYHSAGCLRSTHFYIEFSSDKKVFLTNGKQYLPLN